MRSDCTLKKGEFPMPCILIRRFTEVFVAFVGLISIGNRTFAQEVTKPAQHAIYHSDVDELLTVERVSVLPFTDNLQGIYARPLETHFISLIEKMHRWDYFPSNTSGPLLAPEELENDPAQATKVSEGLGVDGFFACRITKGPNGITVHLSLFLTKDGKLLSQAILKDYKQFDLSDLKEQMQRLLSEIVSRLPYAGRVLSREGNRVTINLGLRDGLQVGQMLSVIQIIQAQRHPKFNFLIRTDKEIFGKIKILKVDETLSFGTVVTEKERDAIQKNAKIGPLDFITYSENAGLALTPSPEDALAQRDDSKVAFGKDAQAWQPQAPPTFGQVGGQVGLSRVSENVDIGSPVGSLSADNNMAPSVMLEGELWITPDWTFYTRLKQGIIPISNPRAGSSPDKLNQQLSQYEAGFGYMFRLGPHVWSPYLEPFLGYFTSNLYSDASTPTAFTSMDYSGFKIGLRGATPIGDGSDYGVGGIFATAFRPVLNESPVSSGSSSTNNVTCFGIFGYKKMSSRLKAVAQLDMEMYSSNFSGSGSRDVSASSASQTFTTLSGGIYYMF
jgi:hypothetical protein